MTQQPEFTPRRGSVSSHYETPKTPPERAPWRLANPMTGQDPAAGLFWVLIGLAAAVFVIDGLWTPSMSASMS